MEPNHIDYARASGEVPPEWGKCSKCKQRTEIDLVSIGGRMFQLCRKCQKLSNEEIRTDPPKELPF